MQHTTNYNLKKPDYADNVDVQDLNDNADIIDATLAAKANLVGGKVPASELPSYVDDVIEGYYYNGVFYEDAGHTTPITGESGKIYVDLSTEDCYRWSGSVYIKISGGGGTVPSGSSANDILYWDADNSQWLAGAITNVIPNADDESY